jgi:hypothetical protein
VLIPGTISYQATTGTKMILLQVIQVCKGP